MLGRTISTSFTTVQAAASIVEGCGGRIGVSPERRLDSSFTVNVQQEDLDRVRPDH